MLFFSTEKGGIVWAESFDAAAAEMGVARENVFSVGATLVPFIVALFCILGFLLCFRMPKDFSPLLVARELKKTDPTLDISEIEAEALTEAQEDKKEIIFVQIGLWVLSGSIFGFIWTGFLLKRLREITNTSKGKNALRWIACSLIPFVSVFMLCKLHKELGEKLGEYGNSKKYKRYKILYIISGIILPLLPLNFIALAVMQKNINKLYNDR